MDFQMSSLGHAIQAVALLRSVGYGDVSMQNREVDDEDEVVVVVTLSANEELGVFPAERLVLAVDPDAHQLS